MTTSNIFLKCVGIDIGYGTKKVYGDLNFQVEPGKMICILGQNGVGKSTLLRTITGNLVPLSGSVELLGKNLSEYSSIELAKRISIVTTEKINSAGMTVFDLLMTGRFPYQSWLNHPTKSDFKSIEQAVTKCEINYLLDRRMSELSDGQRQKVMIARALIQDGNLLILDEPTAHLDLTNSVQVIQLCREIASEQNKAVIISTHELSLALQYADELWLMDFGKEMISGFPEDLALSGTLDHIYHHEQFSYDLVTGKVSTSKQRQWSVDAPSEIKHWIINALDRSDFDPERIGEIVAQEQEKRVNWEFIFKGKTYKGVEVNNLIQTLIDCHESTPGQ